MPYLNIQTNIPIDAPAKADLVRRASALVAHELAKPESYVMVAFAPEQPMMFAGSNAPCAFLQLKSIGLPAARTTELSRVLCELLAEAFNIPPKRVYIEFSDVDASYWGWDRATF